MTIVEHNWRENTNFYTPGMYKIYFSVFIAFLNSAINGYDLSLFGSLATLPQFGNSFVGNPDFQDNSSYFSLSQSILQIGSVIGCFFVGFTADLFGRRGGMFTGSLVIIVGVILELATTSLGVFIFGRFLIGFGVVFVTTSAPVYTVEIAHPAFRGRVTAIYNTGWNVGSIPCSIILFGVTFINDPNAAWAWQLPVGVQGIFSLIVLVGVFFIPESPRWLMARGREEEARKFIVHYHANDQEDHPIVEFTLNEVREALEDERRQNQASYAALFVGRAMLYRTGILLAVAFFSQYAGNWIAGGFAGVFYGYFGFNSKQAQLGFGIVPGVISFITSQVGSAYVDKLGRRTMLIYGSISFAVFFFLIIILETISEATNQIVWATLGFVVLQLFNIAYSFVWTPLNALYPVEILPYSARAKGMALCQLFINAANVVQSWILIYANNAFGWRWFSFYLCFNTLAVVVIWKFFPETKGLSLEEIDSIFSDPNPVAKSLEPRTVTSLEGGIAADAKKPTTLH